VRLTLLTVDAAGASHFADGTIDLVAQAFAPPAAPLEVSAPVPAASGVFFRMPAGWFGDWHPTPRLQYFVQTTGELEVQVSDGEVRRFHPGDVVYVADTHGTGHTTRVIGDVDVCGVFVQLPAP
jgi:quercetin dioxygenase-like cupin family protein